MVKFPLCYDMVCGDFLSPIVIGNRLEYGGKISVNRVEPNSKVLANIFCKKTYDNCLLNQKKCPIINFAVYCVTL